MSPSPEPPLFSLIVAVKNGMPDLASCLTSIQSQTFASRELIVMDGGSQDGSLNLLKKQSGIHWETAPDRGIAHAWNKALTVAQGEWLLFLGADDRLWCPNTLEQLAKTLSSLPPDCCVAYGQVMGIDRNGMVTGPRCSPWSRKRFLQGGGYFSHQGVCHRRTLFQHHGLFDESFQVAMDYELLMRPLQHEDPVYLPDITVAAMGLGGMSSDHRLGPKILGEFRRARRKHALAGVGWPLLWREVTARGKLALFRLTGERVAEKVVEWYRLTGGGWR